MEKLDQIETCYLRDDEGCDLNCENSGCGYLKLLNKGAYSRRDLKYHLEGRRCELQSDLLENDYTQIESVEYSKHQQIDCIETLLQQL